MHAPGRVGAGEALAQDVRSVRTTGPVGPVTVVPMRLHVVDHPLVAHKLTTLRDQRTDSATFRRLADELVTLLAYEATRDVRTEQVDIATPVARTTGVKLSYPRPWWCRSCGRAWACWTAWSGCCRPPRWASSA